MAYQHMRTPSLLPGSESRNDAFSPGAAFESLAGNAAMVQQMQTGTGDRPEGWIDVNLGGSAASSGDLGDTRGGGGNDRSISNPRSGRG